MSWESITTKELLSSVPYSHNLSATHLLASPDAARYLLDNTNGICDYDENHSRLAGYGSSLDGASLWARQNSRNSVVNCFLACQRSLKQYLARRKIERGLRLYEQHNQNAAVRIWCSALKVTSQREDCFQLLGYLYQAHMDWGKYREAIDFGQRQLGISEELDSPNLRAETYMNLSRAHERLGGLERALSYARHSLYNECGTQCRTGGLVHLTVARVYLEMGGFSRALEGLQGAHKIATIIGDSALELQVYVTLSELFGRLQDNEKSVMYASKAYDLSRSLQLGDLNSSHHRAALLRMAGALRKQGDLGDANDYCQEATRLALISGDQATYTRSVRVMGDIYRKKIDIDRAFRQYEQAMGTSAALGDRMAQMEAMDGAARCLETLRLQQKICNCRPLEFNTRLLEVASSIGSKLLVRKIRSRLALIYRDLGDEEQYNTQTRLALQTDAALGLHCGVCGEVFGLESDALEALPCAHILHSRCAHEFLKRRDRNSGSNARNCPACAKIFNSRVHLYGGGGTENKTGELGGNHAAVIEVSQQQQAKTAGVSNKTTTATTTDLSTTTGGGGSAITNGATLLNGGNNLLDVMGMVSKTKLLSPICLSSMMDGVGGMNTLNDEIGGSVGSSATLFVNNAYNMGKGGAGLGIDIDDDIDDNDNDDDDVDDDDDEDQIIYNGLNRSTIARHKKMENAALLRNNLIMPKAIAIQQQQQQQQQKCGPGSVGRVDGGGGTAASDGATIKPMPIYRSNLSLASLSLRASNMTIYSARNDTSSV